jgi:hypothetical protein
MEGGLMEGGSTGCRLLSLAQEEDMQRLREAGG